MSYEYDNFSTFPRVVLIYLLNFNVSMSLSNLKTHSKKYSLSLYILCVKKFFLEFACSCLLK